MFEKIKLELKILLFLLVGALLYWSVFLFETGSSLEAIIPSMPAHNVRYVIAIFQ